MKWDVIFQAKNLALYGEGILTTLALLFSSLGVGAVLSLVFALALTSRSAPLRALPPAASAAATSSADRAPAPTASRAPVMCRTCL